MSWGEDIYSQLSWFQQDKVADANVMVVGCGALGNEVLKNLVLFGVQHITIVDFDRIEPSNLSRSILFSQTDAKAQRLKVEVAAERLRAINPEIRVLPIAGDVEHEVGLGLIRRMDVVIACLDNRWARYCLNRLCMRAGVPWVDGGIEALEGTVRVFAPNKNCYACNLGDEGLKELARRKSCSSIIKREESEGRAPTTPVVASIIAAVEVQEAMKLIHKEELTEGKLTSLCGKMFYYEGQHLSSKLINFIAYDDDCPVHDFWSHIKPSSLNTKITVREALDNLSASLKSKKVVIALRDFCFIDFVADRKTDKIINVMLPDFKAKDFKPNDFYLHEIRAIDSDFKYPELSLGEIGFTPFDVLRVKTDNGETFVEMSDELNYAKILNINNF